MHWARLEASALGSLIAACPHGREEREERNTNISFGRHVYKNYVYNIKENNQITSLEYEQSYKDLGVTFDEKLTFRDHIHDKVHKAHAMLGIIKRNFKHITY